MLQLLVLDIHFVKLLLYRILKRTEREKCDRLSTSILAYFRPTGQLDGNTEIIGLFSEQRDGKTTTTCFVNLQNITLLHSLVNNLVRFRVLLVVSILAVLIDSANILLALIQEVEFYYACAGSICLATNKPVIGTLSLAGYGDILGWLSLQILESSQSQATSRMNWKASSYFS